MKNTYSSLSVAIEELQKKGYDTDFNLVDEGIESKAHKKTWKAGQIEVEEAFAPMSVALTLEDDIDTPGNLQDNFIRLYNRLFTSKYLILFLLCYRRLL